VDTKHVIVDPSLKTGLGIALCKPDDRAILTTRGRCPRMEGAWFEVADLGVDVTPKGFVEAVRGHRPDFVGMSALLTTTMPGMGTTVKALEEAGLRGQGNVRARSSQLSRSR
jgi:hypothetical protein